MDNYVDRKDSRFFWSWPLKHALRSKTWHNTVLWILFRRWICHLHPQFDVYLFSKLLTLNWPCDYEKVVNVRIFKYKFWTLPSTFWCENNKRNNFFCKLTVPTRVKHYFYSKTNKKNGIVKVYSRNWN